MFGALADAVAEPRAYRRYENGPEKKSRGRCGASGQPAAVSGMRTETDAGRLPLGTPFFRLWA